MRDRSLVGWILLFFLCLSPTTQGKNRLNVLLITADDMSQDSVGVFGASLKKLTPNIDKLASEGLRFQHAHVTIAICQPTRAVWMTGLYPHRNGALGFDPIRRGIPTLPQTLQRAGYLTGILGKTAHVIPSRKKAFDVRFGAKDLRNGRSPRLFHQRTLEFIQRSDREARPFFLMVNIHDPHRPFAGSKAEANRRKKGSKAKSDNDGGGFPKADVRFDPKSVPVPSFLPDLPAIRRELAEYYTSVHRADQSVGEVLKALDEAGHRDDTLVMFLSDHGMPLPFSKANCWHQSTRTPWIVRWPGEVASEGLDRTHFVSGIDLFPTILEAVGVEVPDGLDGRSFVPLLRGETQDDREDVFTSINTLSSKRSYVMRAVQDRAFGYVWNPWAGKANYRSESQSGLTFKAMKRAAKNDAAIASRVEHYTKRCQEELYDYRRDPSALNNLVADSSHQEELERLRDRLVEHLSDVEDPHLDAYRAFLAGVRAEEEIPLCWFPKTLPKGSGVQPGELSGFSAGQFSSDAQSFWEWTDPRLVVLHDQDGWTMLTALRLDRAPNEKVAIVSKWRLRDGGRAYELGVDSVGRVYFSVSASGRYDNRAKEITTRRALKVGVPYTLAATFVPGQRMTISVDGDTLVESDEAIPKRCYRADAKVFIGCRTKKKHHLDATIAAVEFSDRALDEDGVRARAREWGFELDAHQKTTLPVTSVLEDPDAPLAPVRALTKGPSFHWFGYYDKAQVDPSGRYVLAQRVHFEHRSPTPDDVIEIGMIDTEQDDQWIPLGESRAWCWQQGCMLQWRPGSATEVLWNDRIDGSFVCHILDVESGLKRTLPRPIYHVHPEGGVAVSLDFSRVQDMRPGYGYPGIPDPNADEMAPPNSGVWILDLDSGRSELIVSLDRVQRTGTLHEGKHYVNHLQWSPEGHRFVLLHRWRSKSFRGFRTRALTADPSGEALRLLSENQGLSHFAWKDEATMLFWTHGAYREIPDDGSMAENVIWRAPNGHQSYLSQDGWLVTDTYPMGPKREQHLYLFETGRSKAVLLGRFSAPRDYAGEWRCDLHPRVDPAHHRVFIDSPHGGHGRQIYVVDIKDHLRF